MNLVDPDGRQTFGGHRNFPPGGVGMGGCRNPSCWTGPEGAPIDTLGADVLKTPIQLRLLDAAPEDVRRYQALLPDSDHLRREYEAEPDA